jgi:hypothetical protein
MSSGAYRIASMTGGYLIFKNGHKRFCQSIEEVNDNGRAII